MPVWHLFLLIQRWQKWKFTNARTSLLKCDGAPSIWNRMAALIINEYLLVILEDYWSKKLNTFLLSNVFVKIRTSDLKMSFDLSNYPVKSWSHHFQNSQHLNTIAYLRTWIEQKACWNSFLSLSFWSGRPLSNSGKAQNFLSQNLFFSKRDGRTRNRLATFQPPAPHHQVSIGNVRPNAMCVLCFESVW